MARINIVDFDAGLTRVETIRISHISSSLTQPATFSRAFFIEGTPENPIEQMSFSDITQQAQESGRIADVNSIRFQRITVVAPAIPHEQNDAYAR